MRNEASEGSLKSQQASGRAESVTADQSSSILPGSGDAGSCRSLLSNYFVGRTQFSVHLVPEVERRPGPSATAISHGSEPLCNHSCSFKARSMVVDLPICLAVSRQDGVCVPLQIDGF